MTASQCLWPSHHFLILAAVEIWEEAVRFNSLWKKKKSNHRQTGCLCVCASGDTVLPGGNVGFLLHRDMKPSSECHTASDFSDKPTENYASVPTLSNVCSKKLCRTVKTANYHLVKQSGSVEKISVVKNINTTTFPHICWEIFAFSRRWCCTREWCGLQMFQLHNFLFILVSNTFTWRNMNRCS